MRTLILPYAETGAAMAAIAEAMGADHHLAAVVSDARAVFRIEGDRANDVLQKLGLREASTATRGWQPRWQGMRRLLRWQLLALGAQAVCLLGALVLKTLP